MHLRKDVVLIIMEIERASMPDPINKTDITLSHLKGMMGHVAMLGVCLPMAWLRLIPKAKRSAFPTKGWHLF